MGAIGNFFRRSGGAAPAALKTSPAPAAASATKMLTPPASSSDTFASDLQRAQRAIAAGKDPLAVKQRMRQAYPNRTAEIDQSF